MVFIRIQKNSGQKQVVTEAFALDRLRRFNPEFCKDKTDAELIFAMSKSPVDTAFWSYHVEVL